MEAFTQQAEVEVGLLLDIVIGSIPPVGVTIPRPPLPPWGTLQRTTLVQAERIVEHRLMGRVGEQW